MIAKSGVSRVTTEFAQIRFAHPIVTPFVTVQPEPSQLPSPTVIGLGASRFTAKLRVSGSNRWFPAGSEQCGPMSTFRPIRTSPFK